MKVFIRRACAAAGQHLAEGQTYDLPDEVAKSLVTMGRALAVSSSDKADDPVRVRDPQIAARDPQIAVGDAGTAALGKKRGK